MKMRLIALLSLLALSAALVACGGATAAGEPAASAGPRLALDAAALELGELPNGVVAERELAVSNNGDAPLVVERVVTSCGCTTAVLEPMTLAPGETGTLRIAFDSGAHGPDLRGPIMRQITMVSNDPARPEAVVEVRATITDPET